MLSFMLRELNVVETAIALQIGLATGEFRAGRYGRGNEWDSTWERDETQSF